MSSGADPRPAPAFDPAVPADTVVRKQRLKRENGGSFFGLRHPIPKWFSIFLGLLCIACVFCAWWWVTRGPGDERIYSPTVLPSPAETYSRESLESMWDRQQFDIRANTWASLRRVMLGFGLAAVIGIPIGVLCGCFPWINSFFAPVNVFGRNIPIAALIPLTFALFGIEERQKIMFIFIATVAFVMMDAAVAVADINSRYIDTAYTLGASRLQIILKVLVPLAMPRIFNSLRLLFGLAFGYIMLSEVIVSDASAGGLGFIINQAKRRTYNEPILIILTVIPLLALAIDRILHWIQCSLFPHQYGGKGYLHIAWRGLMHMGENLKRFVIPAKSLSDAQLAAIQRDHSSPVEKL
jgi:ABC-type nitrate/sulfonate/bicarbonate transport system permease component